MELVRAYALSFLGVPYTFGGATPMGGIDCSGLCIEILKGFGLLGNREDMSAASLALKFPDKVEHGDLGDLAFFGKESISHVGFCLNESVMLSASGGTPDTKDIMTAIKNEAFVKIRPITYRKDFLYLTRPPWGV